MKLFKRLSLVNKILKAYKNIKKLLDNNKNYSNEVKEAFELYRQASEKIVKVCPSYKELYLDILEELHNT